MSLTMFKVPPMTAQLEIGRTGSGAAFRLPIDLATRTQSILAIKGAGKTYTAIVQMEEMLAAGTQCVAIDPTGVWWGLRAGADGKAGGLPVIIFGGDHGDVQLDPAAGEIVAEWLVESGQSAVLDLSAFESNAAQDRFATAFAEKLFRRKATAAARTPLHIFVDEADSFAPQRPLPGQQRMLGAWEAIVRRGRSRGLGLTLITQRPAVLNKNVLTQTELLTCLRISSPQDRKAVEEWINVHGDAEHRKQMMNGLASLPRGAAWFWSPGWLDLFERIEIRRRRTFDSSATPTAGQTPARPQELAPVDLAALSDRIRASVEAVEANDPKRLKQRIRELETALETRRRDHNPELEALRVEVTQLRDDRRRVLEPLQQYAHCLEQRIVEIGKLAAKIDLLRPTVYVVPAAESDHLMVSRSVTNTAKPSTARRTPASADNELNAYQRDLLAVLLDRSPVPTARGQLGALAGRSIKSSAFDPNLRALVDNGLAERTDRGYVATPTAQAACPEHRAAPRSGQDALVFWLNRLPAYEASLLRAIADAHPPGPGVLPEHRRWLDEAAIAEASGKSISSSAFRPALRNLVELGHVERDGQRYRVAEHFFE